MKRTKTVIFGGVLVTLSACGQAYQGNYHGQAQVTQNGAVVSQNVAVALTNSNGTVSGTWNQTAVTSTTTTTTLGNLTGNLTSCVANGNTLTGCQLTLTSSGSSGTVVSYTTSCTGTFTGTLNITNDVLSGSLAASGTNACMITAININTNL